MRQVASWGFHNPVALNVGRGCRVGLADRLSKFPGQSLLVVTSQRGRQRWEADPILGEIGTWHHIVWHDCITENPDVNDLQNGIDALREVHQSHFEDH